VRNVIYPLRRPVLYALLALLAVLNLPAGDFSTYHDYEKMTAALRDLAAEYPEFVRLHEIGRSHDGKVLWVLEIAEPSGRPVSERPGLLIAANFEGSQIFGSELALFIADYLVSSYSSDEEVKRVLDNHVIYILPRANPDGAEKLFTAIKSGERTNNRPFDNDNDGRIDEDGFEDLNGDGVISVMRVKDPKGGYMIHPDNPQLLKKADPAKGESGVYQVYWEGIDNDGDGFYNEDPPGGVDINRNFQHQYPYYQVDAGPYMVSEPETRAVLDFVLAHKNIAQILTFGESDNLVNPPDSRGELKAKAVIEMFQYADRSIEEARKVGIYEVEPPPSRFRFFMMGESSDASSSRPRRPPREPEIRVNTADIPYFKKVSDKYRELTGISSCPAVRIPAGAFFEYGYYQYGVPSFSTPGWGIAGEMKIDDSKREKAAEGEAQAQRAQRRPPSPKRPSGPRSGGSSPNREKEGGDAGFDVRLLEWMEQEDVDGFIEWAPYQHEGLGEVEIGGFRIDAATNPPIAEIDNAGPKHCKFVLYLASLFPKVSIAEIRVTELGGGLFKIEAEVENSGYLPTALAHGVNSRSVRPTMVQLDIPPDNLVSGDAKTSFIQTLAGSGSRKEFTWIVKGEPGAEVRLKVAAQKGGTETVTLKLGGE